ncbi:MAG: NUDIX hydrolase [Chloroflexota bacterium]
MRITGREVAFEGNYLRIVEKHFLTDKGESGIWETVERTNVYDRGAVVVIALTKNKEIILEKNWRVPSESWVIQFPAGLTDRRNEPEAQTARRELLEETGYLAGALIPIMPSPLSPDLTPTQAMHFLARDVEFVGRSGEISADEAVSETIAVPLKQLKNFLLNLPQDVSLDLRVPGILWVLEAKGLI